MGILERMAGWLWGTPVLVALLAVGILTTLATRAVQIRKLGASLKSVGTAMGKKGEGVSSFQAVCTALAATVGTGNVAGVAGALALGGPGAVFWMWVSAFLGMATKYVEVVLALKFRKKDPDGNWVGGPMYYMEQGLGWKRMAKLFALAAVLGSFGMGNLAQIHTISSAVVHAAAEYVPQWDGWHVALVTGGCGAALVAVVTLGGAKRVGRVMELLVPVMAGAYILGGMAVVVTHWQALPGVFSAIFREAFTPRAAIGGGMGTAIRWGISRGIFSNEAGLGSAPIAHASAEATPEQQGLFGIFEVFLDTVVLCTLTAVAILASGVRVPYGNAAGGELASDALASVFGTWAPGLLAACLALLALATLISWNLYGVRCAEYLWGKSGAGVYRVVYVLVILWGATMELGAVWAFADVCNGLMALPNLAAIGVLMVRWGHGDFRESGLGVDEPGHILYDREKYRKEGVFSEKTGLHLLG